MKTFRIDGNQSIKLDQEPTIGLRQPDPARHLTPQYVQLTERCILCFKPTPRLEWHGQDAKNEIQQRDHRGSLSDLAPINANRVFGIHKGQASHRDSIARSYQPKQKSGRPCEKKRRRSSVSV
jgi:hypothetical protein